MIMEYIRYRIPAERQLDFEGAYVKAAEALDASPHCLAYELARFVEEPERYVLRIDWDSLEGHLQGFRSSAEFRRFLGHVRAFVSNIEEMQHYEAMSVRRCAAPQAQASRAPSPLT